MLKPTVTPHFAPHLSAMQFRKSSPSLLPPTTPWQALTEQSYESVSPFDSYSPETQSITSLQPLGPQAATAPPQSTVASREYLPVIVLRQSAQSFALASPKYSVTTVPTAAPAAPAAPATAAPAEPAVPVEPAAPPEPAASPLSLPTVHAAEPITIEPQATTATDKSAQFFMCFPAFLV